MTTIEFDGSSYFRQRIVCSTLSGKAIKIKDIRSDQSDPGLRDYEASLLRLMDKLSNGCKISINSTGTQLFYKPGVLIGGKVEHDCGKSRSIGYFLEALVCLAPFVKKPLDATLTGITNSTDNLDISADLFRTVTLPNLVRFGIEDSLEFHIKKRGAYPDGGGMVHFKCPVIKNLKPINLVDSGEIKQVRGIAYSTKISASVNNRVLVKAKGILLPYIPNVWIYTDPNRGSQSGSSPGYGLALIAETTTGCYISYEQMAVKQQTPEDLATECTNTMLQEIIRGGCVDSSHQSLILLFMALGTTDISKIRIGKLSNYTIEFLRHIQQFFGVKFNISTDPESKTILLTCFGCGYLNIAKETF